MNLRIPGPTPCPPAVLEAMARPMIDHRGPEFAEVLNRVSHRLKTFFQTENDVLILTTSGTGGMEAAIVNTLSPGDRVLSISIGAFGDRFASIAETYGADVVRLRFPWGKAADPAQIRQALEQDPTIKAILVTHNETSTGVTNDLEAIAKTCRQFGDKLILVDAVSSLGAIPLPVDKWGLDVVVTASQKGWMVPPGLAMVSVSQQAWEAYQQAKMPRFYLDFGRAKEFLKNNQTPWTPVISVFFAMDVALDLLLQEGLENIFARHRRIAQVARDGVRELGLQLLANPNHASNTVTAVVGPEGVDISKLRRILREEHGVVVAGGQGQLSGKIFRIGHLGLVSEDEVRAALSALRTVLPKVGYAIPA